MVNPVDLVMDLVLYLLCGEKGSAHRCVVLVCMCMCVCCVDQLVCVMMVRDVYVYRVYKCVV